MEAYRQEIIVGSVVITCCSVLQPACGLCAGRTTAATFCCWPGTWSHVVALALFSSTLSGFGFWRSRPGLLDRRQLFLDGGDFLNGICGRLFLVAKRIRMIAELRDCLSLPDVVAARYGSDAVRF